MTTHPITAWRRLLVMGDSIAVGTGDPVDGFPDRSWAEQLVDVLGRPEYLNLGQYGARAAEIRAGQLARACEFRPDLAVVAAGANDAIRRSFDDPAAQAAVATELTRMVGALHDAGALVVTFGCFDLGRTTFAPPEQRDGISRRLRALGRLTEAITARYNGVYVSFLDHPAAGDHLFSADGLHANRRGHALIAAEVVAALTRHLAPAA